MGFRWVDDVMLQPRLLRGRAATAVIPTGRLSEPPSFQTAVIPAKAGIHLSFVSRVENQSGFRPSPE